jgi:hypothetical protein
MSNPAQWAVLQVFSKLALNNAGSRAKRVIAQFDCRAMHEITSFIARLECSFSCAIKNFNADVVRCIGHFVMNGL